MPEQPWPTFPVKAVLLWTHEHSLGHLHFNDPSGERQVVPVTFGPSVHREKLGPIWHVDLSGETATVSPSIHYVDHFHTPNPVTFLLVESLDDLDA